MDIETFITPGLGDATYLVASDGEAAVIDPQRDAWRFVEAAERWGWRITHVLETHVHNDYVSGANHVRAATGAEIIAPAGGGYRFSGQRAGEGHSVAIGNLNLVAAATPGHTPEHVSWQIVDAGSTVPTAVLTGGSLLVGSAGRPDLFGPALMPGLAGDQFRSIQRLAALPDHVRLLPTHGAGSFCVTGAASTERESTIGLERQRNPFLQIADSDEFLRLMEERLGKYPAYYAHVADINRRGATLRDGVGTPPELTPTRLVELVDAGARVVDARDRYSFARGHVPGAIHVEPTEQFGTWVGAVVPFNAPMLLMVDSTDATLVPELVTQLWRIGYERVIGFVSRGIDSWIEAGRTAEGHQALSARDVVAEIGTGDGRAVLDVRQPTEWREGVVPGSRMIFAGDLPNELQHLPRDRRWTVICRSGARASIAASLLMRAGYQARVVTEGGVPEVIEGLERRRASAQTKATVGQALAGANQ